MDYDALCAYLLQKPGARRDMPFGPDVLVFKVLNKMFTLMAWQADPLTITLKADPVVAIILRRQYLAVTPGYHMNKTHWNTVTLDGSLPDDEVQQMIDDSYELVVQGMTRAEQAKLKMMGWAHDGSQA
ncbi:MAG: MmcQ/YjbR family DNA-binding protein [Brevefilum sp.]